jgi:hypothetical protein
VWKRFFIDGEGETIKIAEKRKTTVEQNENKYKLISHSWDNKTEFPMKCFMRNLVPK